MAKRLQLPIGDAHFRAIGRISVNLEYLQERMHFWAWTLIGPQRIGQIVTAGMSFRNSSRLLGALAGELLVDAGDKKKLLALLKSADKLEERRNEVLHSCWGGGGDAPVRIKSKISSRRLIFDGEERLTAEQLNAIADDIESICIAMQDLLIDVCGR